MMNYVLLWIIGLASSLLFVAVIAALASRCKKTRWRKFWPILTAVIIFFILASNAVLGGVLLKYNVQPKWLLWYGLSQIIAFLIGMIMILKRGLKGVASEDQEARSWNRILLIITLVLFFIIYMVILNFMEKRITVDLAIAKTEAFDKIISLMPPRIPDSYNAYPIYDQASKSLGRRNDLPKWFQDIFDPNFDPTSNEVKSFLAKHQETLAMIHQAASLPDYYIEMDQESFFDPNSEIPYFIHYLDFARLLSLSARSKVMNSNLLGSLQDFSVMENMSAHLRSFPGLLPLMIAVAVDQVRSQGLEYVLAHTPDPAPGLIHLPLAAHSSAIKSYLDVQRLEVLRSLGTNATSFGSGFFYLPINEPEYGLKKIPIPVKLWRVLLFSSELKAQKNIIIPNLYKQAETYEEVYKNTKAVIEMKESGGLGFSSQFFSLHFLPLSYMFRAMKNDAQNGLSDVALAAIAYKAAKGKYPSRMEDLTPDYITEIPTDPFDGKPLKIKVVEDGLDLYSVGTNLMYESDQFFSKNPIHFYLGQRAYHKYRVEPAEKERIKKYNKNDTKKSLSKGIEIASQGKFKEAKEEFRSILNVGPAKRALKVIEDVESKKIDKKEAVHFFNGWTHAIKNNWNESIVEYNKAIEINPRFSEAYVNRGIVYRALGQYQRAIKDYDEAIRIDPENQAAQDELYFARMILERPWSKEEQAFWWLWQVCFAIAFFSGILKGRKVFGFLLGIAGPFGAIAVLCTPSAIKRCIACKNTIPQKAVKCPHCQTDQPEKLILEEELPVKKRLIKWLFLYVPILLWLLTVGSCIYKQHRTDRLMMEAEGLIWGDNSAQLIVHVQEKMIGEENHYQIQVVKPNGEIVHESEMVIDYDMWGGGFVKAVNADDDEELEVVAWGAHEERESFYLDYLESNVQKKSFSKASTETKSLAREWHNAQFADEVPFVLFLLLIVYYILFGLVSLIVRLWRRRKLKASILAVFIYPYSALKQSMCILLNLL